MDVIDVGFSPSALSSSFACPVPSGHSNELATALQHARPHSSPKRGARLLLERLSQSSAFEAPRYQRGTAEPPAAAENLPGLVMPSALMVTLLGGPTSRNIALCPGLPSGHSFRQHSCRFLGAETRSAPVPASDDFSRFGTVSIRTYSQGLSPVSWLSFSPPGV